MKAVIIIVMAISAYTMLSLFFKDIEDKEWQSSATQELVAGILATMATGFMLIF